MRLLYINGEREYLHDRSSLPYLMKARKQTARVLMPLYGELQIRFAASMEYMGSFAVKGFVEQVGLFRLTHQRVCYYFLENSHYFGAGKLYDPALDKERFIFFCRGVASVMAHLDFKPDLIHLKGWRTALVPLFLQGTRWEAIPTVFELGNLWEQGGLTPDILALIPELSKNTVQKLSEQSALTFMGLGIETAHHLLAKSPEEGKALLSPTFSPGMDAFMRTHYQKLSGISGAIDSSRWNPLKDPSLVANYGKGDARRRTPNRTAVCKAYHLEETQPVIFGIDDIRLTLPRGIPTINPSNAQYTQVLAGADFVITGIDNLWEVACYGAIPIFCREKILPTNILDIAQNGTVLLWRREDSTSLPAALEQAATLSKNSKTMRELHEKNMSLVRDYSQLCKDTLSLYSKICKKSTEQDW